MLTKEANLDNLPQWPQDDVLCVCNGDHYSENSICSANEEDTCTQAVDAPGIEVSRTSRVKRADDADVSFDADMRRRLRELHSFVLETHMTGISKVIYVSSEAFILNFIKWCFDKKKWPST